MVLSHETTYLCLANMLKVTRGFISNIETGKKAISLEKTLDIAKRLKKSTNVYARVWFETQAREAGLDFKKIITKIAV